MRTTLAAAALAATAAITGLTLSPTTAHATTTSATTGVVWGKFFSSDHKAYTFGKTVKHGDKIRTTWHGVDKPGGKRAWVWFEIYQNGHWRSFNHSWDGKTTGVWSGRGITKVYTFTCWAGKNDNCGRKYRIY
ncbi:hypothetical protein HTZ77_17390 [Nonomuraea sp. SMC257]|uniref:Lactococcin 972 family bacteriocin n=1 Tax=Nonomuraea montanisoli TaxID=2741721 RepID=A0A7Y6I7M5_9ACTN|nr:hypothetical protein [Nonomuraea montanisoli]NUW33192.1 hypothetical protein [Nonomuraea montanisoli]